MKRSITLIAFFPGIAILMLVFVCTGLLFSNPVFAGKLYKWVDEDGQIRYSDRLPPAQSSQRFQTLAPDGRVVGTKEKSKTPAQLRRERADKKRLEMEAQKKAEHEARIIAEQKHHDDVLMLTFSNEKEIGEAKDARIEVIDSVIKLLKKDIAEEDQRLADLNHQARIKYLQHGKEVPGGMAQNIEYSIAKITSKKAQLDVKNSERDKIIAQYEKDLLRYRELSAYKKSVNSRKQD